MERIQRFTQLFAIAAACCLAPVVQAQDSGGGEGPPITDVFEAPANLSACQTHYGDMGQVRLGWSNPERFERVAVYVDGMESETYVDGAHNGVVVEAAPGVHTFEVEGFVGDLSSAESALEFEVLLESPVADPVSDLDCEFVVGAAHALVVDWVLGADSWTEGEVRFGGRRGNIGFDATADHVDIMLAGDRPESVEVAFKEGAYFSDPILIPCIQLQPAFRRGDCDTNGVVNITDPIFTVNHLFKGRTRWYCDDACDANDDGMIDLSDALTELRYLFQAEMPPVTPGPEACGIDSTEDFLGGICTQACPSASA